MRKLRELAFHSPWIALGLRLMDYVYLTNESKNVILMYARSKTKHEAFSRNFENLISSTYTLDTRVHKTPERGTSTATYDVMAKPWQ